MTRLGINVPKELLDRLKPFKGTINVSQVCRDALEAQVAAYERAKSRVGEADLSDLVERFYQEHADRDIDWEELGREDGTVWAELASLEQLETLMYRLSFVGRPGMLQRQTIDIVPSVEGTKLFDDRWHEKQDWFLERYDLDENTNHLEKAKSAYELGWFSYARVIWGLVQEKLGRSMDSRVTGEKERQSEVGVTGTSEADSRETGR